MSVKGERMWQSDVVLVECLGAPWGAPLAVSLGTASAGFDLAILQLVLTGAAVQAEALRPPALAFLGIEAAAARLVIRRQRAAGATSAALHHP